MIHFLKAHKDIFGISELNIEGKVVGIGIKNIDWFYVGSERGGWISVYSFNQIMMLPLFVRTQVNLTKYLDFRFWTPGKIVEWDDLLDIAKRPMA